jgi:phosphate-selective porin OprO/OprP
LLAGAFAAAAPAALAQTVSTGAPHPSGVSEEQALALAARLDALEKRNAELEAQVAGLKAQVAAIRPAPAASGAAPAGASLADGRPALASADGRFTAALRGIFQFDAATYDQAPAGPLASDLRRSGPALGASAANVDLARARALKAGDLVRRARFGVDGKAFGDWSYRLLFDFGGSGVENAGQLYEGWIQYDGFAPAHLKVGAFSPSLGLDDQASTNGMPFLERSAIAELARGLAGGDTRTAAQAYGYGERWFAAAAITGRTLGSLNTGTASPTSQSFGDPLAFTGRIAATPLRGPGWLTHVGLHGSWLDHPADTAGPGPDGVAPPSARAVTFSIAPESRVDATRLINTGAIPARHAGTLGAEVAAQRGNLLLQAEYERLEVLRSDHQPDPRFDGFYVSGTWVITGEARTYNRQTAAFDAPPVAHPFDPARGDWGAWEAAVRYAEADLDFRPGAAGSLPGAASIRGGEQTALSAGVNWYWNAFARVMLDYQHVRVDRLSPAASTAAAATLWLTPPGAPIGQSFDIWSVRTQFAF